MKLLVDSNVVAAAAAGNELAQEALDQSGAAMTGTPEMLAVALDVAEELFEEFTAEYDETVETETETEQDAAHEVAA